MYSGNAAKISIDGEKLECVDQLIYLESKVQKIMTAAKRFRNGLE